MSEVKINKESERIEHIVSLVTRLIKRGTTKQYHQFFQKYHEADIADALQEISKKECLKFFRKVQPEIGVDILEEMEPEHQVQLIGDFKTELAAKYIEEMEPDEAVDLLEELIEEDEEKAEEIIEALSQEDAEDIKELMSYQEDTAGAIMTPDFIWIPENLLISEAIEAFKKQEPPDSEVSFYIFIVDDKYKLVGYTSLRNLLLSNPKEKVKSIRNDYPIKVDVNMDQEKVAQVFQKYDYAVVPVVDANEHLVGIVTVDDVVDVVVEEATEDIYKLSGTADIDESKQLYGKTIHAVLSRLPWLLLTVAGGLIAAFIMKVFADNFPVGLIPLAISLSFVPLLMGLGGNAGNQSATIIVRGLATGMLKEKGGLKFVLRESLVGLSIGIIIACIVFAVMLLANQVVAFSLIVSLSIIANILVATFLGSALPIFFRKLNIDPAIASAPFISTTLDIIGQLIYFLLTIGAILFFL